MQMMTKENGVKVRSLPRVKTGDETMESHEDPEMKKIL
jgi:hypothetical protein